MSEPCLHVCWTGPTRVLREDPVPDRWCFVCRARVPFTDRLWAEIEPSYYEPTWERKCERGHTDGDLFPGWSRRE